MSNTFVKLKVFGAFACFSRPEMKVERVSYEVMTPSAARGILDSILWKPEMRWIVTRISVLRPIRTIRVRRNELQTKLAPGSVQKWIKDPTQYQPQLTGAGTEDVTPRQTLALKDVEYVIEAEPHVFQPTHENTPTKYMAMFNERVSKGRCYLHPCLGCREFAAHFELPQGDEQPIEDNRDLGWMLYDIAFDTDKKRAEHQALFFQARLEGGVLNTCPEHVLPDIKTREEAVSCLSRR